MPLIVGIENGIDKGFTKSEISLVNGFGFGMLAMNAGVGSMSRSKYGVTITPEVFRKRMLMCNFVNRIYNMEALYDMLTLEFCERLQEAEWSCNVANLNDEDFEVAYTQWMRRISRMDFDAYERKMASRGEEE